MANKKYEALIGKKTEQKTMEELQEQFPNGKLIEIGRETEEGQNGKEVVTNPGKQFFLSKPGRGTIKFAMSNQFTTAGKMDTISPGEVLINNCWVAGDEEIKTDDKFFIRACIEASTFLNEVTGFL